MQLRNHDLTGVDLSEAILVNGYIEKADLTGADLTGAVLEEVTLTGAIADQRTVWPDGFDPEGADIKLM